MTLLHARELVRDSKYFYFALVFPFGMLGIFLGINALLPKGPSVPDFTATVIPMSLFLAVTSSALTVTAGPLTEMRTKGTLKLLGTTPLGRTRLIMTHMAIRVVMVAFQSVLLLTVAVAIGAVAISAVPVMFGITLLGMAMFGSIGYLIGGRLKSANAAANVGNLLQLASLFLSGLAFPLWLMPSALANVLSFLPTTFYADLMMTQISESKSSHPAWLSVLVVVSVACMAIFASIRTFKWDQGEDQ
ncbi:ABC transporter permease [Streptomyces sp. NBC_01077]|uniref:ABC transporter permease n=1 Tax=Streptomyces sp. NBC_01077 TaxID=2903746 RepID=UPI00386F49FF|nr:ABC transporter permease [Streptomyces sp. NBC_01077]WSV43647.1 ABC transporter permease [Streptomyces sp. NBC_01077]